MRVTLVGRWQGRALLISRRVPGPAPQRRRAGGRKQKQKTKGGAAAASATCSSAAHEAAALATRHDAARHRRHEHDAALRWQHGTRSLSSAAAQPSDASSRSISVEAKLSRLEEAVTRLAHAHHSQLAAAKPTPLPAPGAQRRRGLPWCRRRQRIDADARGGVASQPPRGCGSLRRVSSYLHDLQRMKLVQCLTSMYCSKSSGSSGWRRGGDWYGWGSCHFLTLDCV